MEQYQAHGDEQLHFLLEFLSLCESSGFIQLKLPLSQLRGKLEELWSEFFSCDVKDTPTATCSCDGLMSPSHAASDVSTRDVRSSESESEGEEERDVGNGGTREVEGESGTGGDVEIVGTREVEGESGTGGDVENVGTREVEGESGTGGDVEDISIRGVCSAGSEGEEERDMGNVGTREVEGESGIGGDVENVGTREGEGENGTEGEVEDISIRGVCSAGSEGERETEEEMEDESTRDVWTTGSEGERETEEEMEDESTRDVWTAGSEGERETEGEMEDDSTRDVWTAGRKGEESERGGDVGDEEDEGGIDEFNWTVLTPNLSCTSDFEETGGAVAGKKEAPVLNNAKKKVEVVGAEEGGKESAKNITRLTTNTLSEDSDKLVSPLCTQTPGEAEEDSALHSQTDSLECRDTSLVASTTDEYSPVIAQPNFDDLSTTCSTACTVEDTPPSSCAAGRNNSSAVSSPYTPSPIQASQASSFSNSDTCLSIQNSTSPTTNVVKQEPRRRATNGQGEETAVIVLDSSDEEGADSKLEDLFADMRLQSTKKREAAKIPSRKSLSTFIVSDSDVEGDDEDCTVQGTATNFKTPHEVPSCSKTSAAFTPYTPYTALVFWGSSPGENSTTSLEPDKRLGKYMTAPPNAKRQPLVERNISPCTPGISAGPRGCAMATNPSTHKTFSRHRKTIAMELFTFFNCTVFSSELPADMELIWNSKLRTTAGYCRNSGTMSNRKSQIELSTKVIDSYERLKNTLIHEMCHAAVWLINGVKNGGHKRHWQAWALRANTVHPDLDPITRCHNYSISYKYTYKCTRCDYKLGRHSKSVNVLTARCPFCQSCLELEPRLNPDGTPAAVKLNSYAQYVKENYAEVKLQTPLGGHKAVMEKLREYYHNSRSKLPILHFGDSCTED